MPEINLKWLTATKLDHNCFPHLGEALLPASYVPKVKEKKMEQGTKRKDNKQYLNPTGDLIACKQII